MKTSRRHFLKIGGISIAATGIVPAIFNSCTPEEKANIFTSEIAGITPLNGEDYAKRMEKMVR